MEPLEPGGLRTILGVTCVLYVLVMYAIAFWVRGEISTNADFLVAGRRLPLSLVWMTLLATWFGAGTMLTAADEVRQEGLRAAALDPFGAGICLLLAGFLVARPLWRLQLLTVPDLFRLRYGRRAEVVAAIIIVPGFVGWIAAQFVALSQMLALFFGIDPVVGIVLVAAIGMGYTLMGGMWSVTLTDAIQVVLVLGGLVVLTGSVLAQLGSGSLVDGWLRLNRELPAESWVVIPLSERRELWGWVGVLAVGALGNLSGQDLIQRIFSSRSESTAQNACLVAGGMYLLFGMLPLILGLAAQLLFPDREVSILPALAGTFLEPAIAVVFLVALMSAVLSTIDSALLAPSGVIAQNILRASGRWSMLQMNRFAVLGVTVASIGLALVGEDAWSLLESAYALGLVGLLVPMLFGIWIQPRGEWSALASMLVGTAAWGFHEFHDWGVFLHGIPAWSRMHLPVGLSSAGLSLLAFLLFEPPWSWRRPPAGPIDPVHSNTQG